MNKKILVTILLTVLVISGIGVGIFFYFNKEKDSDESNDTPTIEDMKDAKKETLDTSGYTDCMEEVEAQEKENDECIKNKLEKSGYTDDIDCIQNYENIVCKSDARYNAEVEASNTCAEEIYSPEDLTIFDCQKLYEKATDD